MANSLKLISIAINRPMPLPGHTDSTKFTAVLLYMPSKESAPNADNAERAHYAHKHFSSWEELSEWIFTMPIGSPLPEGQASPLTAVH